MASCGGKGDKGEHFDSCVVWDSNNQRWDEHMMGPLPQKREYHSVVTLENVGVYIIGGNGSKNSMSTSDFLPANTFQWTRGPGLPKDVSTHVSGCAVVISDTSFIYINSGIIREYKQVQTGFWMDRNRWPAISSRHWVGCARIGSSVLIAGGYRRREYQRDTYVFDIANRTRRLGGFLATPRAYYHLATVTTGGLTKTFVLGGDDGSGSISSVEEWDEENLTWNPADDLEEARYIFAAITVPLSLVCSDSTMI